MKKDVKKIKKKSKNNLSFLSTEHPTFKIPKTFGQKAADWITKWAGSWAFILLFFIFLIIWMATNGYFVLKFIDEGIIDPYPFILLNLALSCLAAIQAPIILMSQNREAQKDRLKAQYDYAVNRKAEREIEQLQDEIREIKMLLVGKKNSGKMK